MAEFSKDQQVATFLATCRTASLATAGDDGELFNANIQYASDAAWQLYWVSAEASQHSRNVVANGKAAVTIYAHQDTPELIHGLQLRGTAKVLAGPEAELALSLYAAKYPFVTGPPYDQAMKMQLFYRFTPTWLRWIDNREGFGRKFEKNLAES